MLWTLRIFWYLQVLLGLGRLSGLIAAGRLWETHISLGILIPILSLVALKPHPDLPADPMRTLARFAPLVVLLVGLLLYFGLAGGMWVVWLHALLGLVALGLTERAAGRQRRILEAKAAAD